MFFNQYANDVQNALRSISEDRVFDAVGVLRRAQFRNSSVYIIGNGGSAATASHLANDLLKMARVRAFALPDFAPTITAYGNDEGWEKSMYASPLRRLLKSEDVLVCISCSGNSMNIVESIRLAKEHALPYLKTILLTGADVNSVAVKLQPDVVIYVPFKDIRVQEDCHLVICHAIAGALANDQT